MSRNTGNIPGYTARETARIVQFVADFKADPRPYWQRLIDNARTPEQRAELVAHFAIEANR